MSIKSTPSQVQYSTVKIQKWKKGSKANNSVWNCLRNAGYTNKEIKEKNLVQQVAKENKLKDPNVVQIGQELRIPVKIGDKRNEKPGKSDISKSQHFTKVQSDVSKGITGGKISHDHKTEGHGNGKHDVHGQGHDKHDAHGQGHDKHDAHGQGHGEHGHHVEKSFSGSIKKGPVELGAHGKAEAGSHSESSSHAHFGEHGYDLGAHSKAGAHAGAEVGGKVKVGEAELSGHALAEAEAHAEAGAHAKAELTENGYKSSMGAHAGAHAEVKAEAGGKIKVGDVEASGAGFAEAKAGAHAGVHQDLEFSKDKVKIDQGIGAKAEAEAVIGAEGEIKTEGGHIKGKYETGFEALAEAEAKGKFEVGKDGFEIGGRLAARAEAGHIDRFTVDAKTKAGSGIDATVKVGEGADVGGVLGGGLKVDKKGIRAEVEIGGALGLEGYVKVGGEFKYEDMKKPEFIAGSMIGGPIGGVAAVMARPYVEKGAKAVKDGAVYVKDKAVEYGNKAGEAISDGAGYVKDKAIKYGKIAGDGISTAYDATSKAVGGTVSTIADGAKSLWSSIWD